MHACLIRSSFPPIILEFESINSLIEGFHNVCELYITKVRARRNKLLGNSLDNKIISFGNIYGKTGNQFIKKNHGLDPF